MHLSSLGKKEVAEAEDGVCKGPVVDGSKDSGLGEGEYRKDKSVCSPANEEMKLLR
jgi:hypothetical protein